MTSAPDIRGRRVLMTADTVGGVWPFALDLAGSVGAHGGAVVLATLGRRPDAAQWQAARAVPQLQLIETDLALEWQDPRARDLRRSRRVLEMLAREADADLVHVNGFREAAWSWQRPVVVTAHSCVATWWLACHGGSVPAEWQPYVSALRRGLVAADRVVAPTHAFLAALRQVHGALPSAQVIHNGRSAWKYRALEKEPVILSAGRLWDEAKNVRLLIEIADRLPWPVCLAGDSQDAEASSPNVTYLGRQSPDRIAVTMARAAIYAAPNRYEPFGLAVLEAALSGCTLVLSDIPTLREIWSGAACFVAPDDRAGWVECLQRLASAPGERRRLAARARQRALRFSAESMGRKYIALYAELLQESPRRVAA